jgi:hypothetical protein
MGVVVMLGPHLSGVRGVYCSDHLSERSPALHVSVELSKVK